MQQEKSRAMFSTPERPVRSRVFAIFEATLSKRLESTASRTPSKLRSVPFAVSFLATAPYSLFP